LSSLFVGFPLAVLAIFLIIATVFRSYVQPIIIMVTIPFGQIGAVLGHMLFNEPVSMMSMFGMVALTGIVVNDAIVLIEAVNHRLSEGMPLHDALREAGKRRFRAIFLTTITTFIGLTPIIFETSLQAQYLKPMAISIAFGVAFATIITLILVPCVMMVVSDIRRILYFSWFLKWEPREKLEPRAKSSALPNPE
jgi:multidrug efflux pump subunit AcrB